MRILQCAAVALGLSLSYAAPGEAQTVANLAVLKGLGPLTVLGKTQSGKAALSSNYAVTGGIQTGDIRQSTLLPFTEQQQQALRDAYITDGNLAELADGLGTTLGSAYVARAHYQDREHFTSISQAVADLIAYTNSTTGSDSNAGKYFFANGTTDGKTPVSAEAADILKQIGGTTDMFGANYGRPAGTSGADAFGDSRPFQTEPQILPIVGRDYFGVPANNTVYNRGPVMNLIDSPSFPSGHTTYGFMGSILLAVLVPERYPQMITRASEYGNDRILMGAHYAMDVLGGRTLATYDLAHLLANDPAYVGQTLKGAPVIKDYQAAVTAARADLTETLKTICGAEIKACAQDDIGRLSNPAMNQAAYDATQTYGLPVVYPKNFGVKEDVNTLAPEAGHLLTAAFPSLTLDEANQILTETEGPGGGFLDDGSSFGVYSRLNLYAASLSAIDLSERKAAQSK
ncbi:PA-phosphatase [Rhizobium sp. AC27/96]|uniref:phosphatase PAP2 family protein n=1 Tax=Rhizobium TaxID=379 RepID=UPI0008288E66|nr:MULTISPECIES: phosphatase PAP2 family protein [Rhizobium]NTF46191.1 phosphatase PAP2 family protein [Rhizobium rhizogenes]OCJ04032.1 PA-phosphatase [Rhizobium sp. AC27/96]